MDDRLRKIVTAIGRERGNIVVLTGAGVSAESGIPTFRGEEGYWTVGSTVYHPQELATWSAFSQEPTLVWPWYLYRRTMCRGADPNPAHHALTEIESALADRFTLVTQNVDGLHLRAGNSTDRTWEIHGNIDYMRCASACRDDRMPVPELGPVGRGAGFDPTWHEALHCTDCGSWTRPHVLWFDECYDEAWYRYESAQRAAHTADLLVVAGTAGATSLPATMGQIAQRRGIPVIDINPEPNPFSRIAQQSPGDWIQSPATEGFCALAEALLDR
jgi:NAD-dependent deacetylase